MNKGPKPKDLTGQTFGNLQVISKGNYDSKNRRHSFICRCSCGNTVELFPRYLKSGDKTNCGCIKLRRPDIQKPDAVWNKLFGAYKSNAKRRGLKVEITLEEFKALCQQQCWYCGVPPLKVFKYKHDESRNIMYNGVDRLFNDDDYTTENSVPCCSVCNYLKREVDHIDFLAHIKSIAEHNLKMKSEPYDFEELFK